MGGRVGKETREGGKALSGRKKGVGGRVGKGKGNIVAALYGYVQGTRDEGRYYVAFTSQVFCSLIFLGKGAKL